MKDDIGSGPRDTRVAGQHSKSRKAVKAETPVGEIHINGLLVGAMFISGEQAIFNSPGLLNSSGAFHLTDLQWSDASETLAINVVGNLVALVRDGFLSHGQEQAARNGREQLQRWAIGASTAAQDFAINGQGLEHEKALKMCKFILIV